MTEGINIQNDEEIQKALAELCPSDYDAIKGDIQKSKLPQKYLNIEDCYYS